MKKAMPGITLIFAIVLTLFIGGEAQADVFNDKFRLTPDSTWETGNTVREFIYLGIAVADAATTADIQNHSDIVEVNPLAKAVMGENPKGAETAAYFMVTTALHYAVSVNLNPKYRKVWQNTTIVVGGLVVANNLRIGLRFGF